ncbi:CPBP family intramembrane glutamic endopeptidase [Caldicellulosiruptor sp. F32]|uniref:CPBP family intramembrane glutamic endopeptidase n=1 Tax=Caldicellulosiruptor sp. F32 TaxID=1214564 RepID=UPI000584AE9C|nr:CPBP family intramembrane glutamic endopeptidase [Caldicellulosiruptor sp. F32]
MLKLCNFRKIIFKDAIYTIILAISFLFISAIIDSISIMTPFKERYENSMQRFISSEATALIVFTIVVAAPIFEEFVFRGLIFGTMLENQMNIYLAVIIQALLFGLFHSNLYQGMFAFFIGVFSALVLYWTNSIWNSIIFHATVNSFRLIGLLFMSDKVANAENNSSIKGSIFMLIILGIALMYKPMRYFYKRKSEIRNKSKEELSPS